MLLTEDEAKTKTCPQATTYEEFSYCNASGCMAWRWQSVDIVDDAFQAAQLKRMKEANEVHKVAFKYVSEHRDEFGLPMIPTKGWCGLAGRPDETPRVLR